MKVIKKSRNRTTRQEKGSEEVRCLCVQVCQCVNECLNVGLKKEMKNERERKSVCVCVCEERQRKSVCVCCVCVCVCVCSLCPVLFDFRCNEARG